MRFCPMWSPRGSQLESLACLVWKGTLYTRAPSLGTSLGGLGQKAQESPLWDMAMNWPCCLHAPGSYLASSALHPIILY